MVSRSYHPPPHQHPYDGARYLSGRLCAPYSSTYSERRYLPSHDARAITMTDPQSDDNTPPRKRIAVACGRCRKRKIRCSGDPGGGMPCVNCKNAGVDQCLFLRVQSHETAMRDDNNNRYEYNMDVSRTLAQRGAGSMAHMTSSLAQYPQDMPLLASGGMPTSYRGNGYPNVNTKGYYYSMGADLTDAYGADGSVDYGLSCSPYQVISSDPVQMPVAPSYGTWPTTTRPKSTNQGAAGGGLYMDSESAYGAYGAAGSATSLVHRPAVSVAGDSSPYSFSGFAASLPSAGANSSTERLLPTPVSRAAAASNYRADGLPANTASCYASSNKSDHQSPTSVVGAPTGIQGSPTSPLSEVTGYASSAYGYAGARPSHHHQHQHHHHHGGNSTADVYASVSNGGPETIFGDADRSAGTQGSAVDLSGYTYGAASPADSSSLRRASSGSGLTSRSTADSSSGSSVSYVSSGEGGPPSSLGQGATAAAAAAAAYHHSSSSSAAHGHLHQHPGHNHHHQHQHQHQQHHNHSQQQHHASAVHHHASPRHGSHHIAEQRIVAGSTAYGAGSTGSNGAGSGIGGSGVSGNTASAADSSHHRPSVSTRR